jgi:hypothetical protein
MRQATKRVPLVIRCIVLFIFLCAGTTWVILGTLAILLQEIEHLIIEAYRFLTSRGKA